jgi:hypothetical protein
MAVASGGLSAFKVASTLEHSAIRQELCLRTCALKGNVGSSTSSAAFLKESPYSSTVSEADILTVVQLLHLSN